jgi:hypothetical protein
MGPVLLPLLQPEAHVDLTGVQYGCSPGELLGVVLPKATDVPHPNVWTFNIDMCFEWGARATGL